MVCLLTYFTKMSSHHTVVDSRTPMKMLSHCIALDKEVPVNFGSHLDPKSGFGPDRLGGGLRSPSVLIKLIKATPTLVGEAFICYL